MLDNFVNIWIQTKCIAIIFSRDVLDARSVTDSDTHVSVTPLNDRLGCRDLCTAYRHLRH